MLNLLTNSYDFVENSILKVGNAYHFTEKDNEINGDSYHQPENDSQVNINSYHSLENDILNKCNSYDAKMVGVSKEVASTLQKMVGVTNNELPQSEPESIDINTLDHHKYMAGLRIAMLKCNNDSVKNAGIILKQLYQNPKQSHKELKKLTGLSIDGMAKHIRMLKKRELIHRTGYQQYELTEKSLKILRGGMG